MERQTHPMRAIAAICKLVCQPKCSVGAPHYPRCWLSSSALEPTFDIARLRCCDTNGFVSRLLSCRPSRHHRLRTASSAWSWRSGLYISSWNGAAFLDLCLTNAYLTYFSLDSCRLLSRYAVSSDTFRCCVRMSVCSAIVQYVRQSPAEDSRQPGQDWPSR